MAAFDVSAFMEPVSDEAPCGDDLEYDSEFGELTRAAEGKPEQVMGDEVHPAERPNWREVDEFAQGLMARTRDLRIATHLAQAQLNLEGLPGFVAGLELIYGLSTTYWDSVFPLLVDEDGVEDPDYRVNSLAALNDRDEIVGSLGRAVLVSSRALGRFSLRDMRLASGEISPGEDEEAPDPTHIDAAFLEVELDELTESSAAADRAHELVEAMDTYYREQLGVEITPDFSNLLEELDEVRKALREQLSRRGVDQPEIEGAGGDAGGAGSAAAMRPGEINSREDAIRVIEKLCEYFRKHEPSSPVPLLLQRAKRLVSKDFMEILRDLTPDGVSQAEMIGGVEGGDDY